MAELHINSYKFAKRWLVVQYANTVVINRIGSCTDRQRDQCHFTFSESDESIKSMRKYQDEVGSCTQLFRGDLVNC